MKNTTTDKKTRFHSDLKAEIAFCSLAFVMLAFGAFFINSLERDFWVSDVETLGVVESFKPNNVPPMTAPKIAVAQAHCKVAKMDTRFTYNDADMIVYVQCIPKKNKKPIKDVMPNVPDMIVPSFKGVGPEWSL